ncbi:MAG TPA: class I SAM-dependent methyltransferase [Pseudomonadales bacterium]
MFDALFARLADRPALAGADAMRLFHGRGHCYPGLAMINIDWFDPVLWVVIYQQLEPDDQQQLFAGLQQLAAANPAIACVAVQFRARGARGQTVIYGALPAQCLAKEGDLQFQLNFADNQNIGFFLDARPARDWVRQHAAGKRVLNLFAYTCSFSVAALAGGAQSVVNIDMARAALATGQHNHHLNGLAGRDVHFLPHDVFRSTRKLENLGPYDLVIADPPSRQKGSFEADKDYGKLLRKLAPMLAHDAQILACLNAPYLGADFLPQQFAAALPACTLRERLPQREDFPEQDADCCLKMQVFGTA